MSASDKFWDKTADKYAASPISDQAKYERKLKETQQYFNPDMHILEFGCGTGSTAIEHAKHVRRIDAIDISDNMLDIGKNKAKAAEISNITFTRATLQEFDAEADSLDAVLGLNVIHLIPDWQATIAEVARVLKPGGIFVSNTVCLGESTLRFLNLIAPLARMFGLMPELVIIKEGELIAEMNANGFEVENRWHHSRDGISVFSIARKK